MPSLTLDIPPGLNSDDTTFSAKGRWADGNNVRFWNGKPQVIGYMIAGAQALGANLSAIHAWSYNNTTYLAYGTGGNLYYGAFLNEPVDISPVSLGTVESWSLDNFGDRLLACKQGGKLYLKDLTSGGLGATEITEAPDQITYMLVTPERQVLAFGCNEEVSGTFNGLCIRGSDIEDYTSWTTSPTNNAFEHILEGIGQIVAARLVGQYVAVWTTNSLYMGQFIGDPSQTYRFDKVSDNCGLVGPHAVACYNGVAYWVGHDLRVYQWSPGARPEVLPCPISRDFINNCSIGQKPRICVGTVSKFSELWICYGDTRDTNGYSENTRYIAVSLLDGTWFRGQMGRTAILDSGLVHASFTGHPSALFMADAAGNICVHESSFEFPFTSRTWHIQTADQFLDGNRKRMMVRSVEPDFEDQSDVVSLTLYVRDGPQSAALTKGPFALVTTTTRKGIRTSGRIVAAKFSGSGAASYMRLGSPVFDIVPLGER